MRGSAAVAARLHPAAERRRRCKCADSQPPTERFASSVDAWQRGCGIQQLSDAVDVEDFKSAAV